MSHSTTAPPPRYKQLTIIGEGTYGLVVKARDTLDGNIVAIKMCKPPDKNDNTIGLPVSILRETAVLRALADHSNIVHLRAVFAEHTTDQAAFLVFDFYPMTLHQYLRDWNEPLPDNITLNIFSQIVSAIHYAHGKHIVHHDLKPENIMLTTDLVVKVGDFGMARSLSFPFHKYTMPVVTIWYRAPELLLGCANYDLTIDIWSLGCVLGEMMTCQPMFTGNDHVEQLSLISRVLGSFDERTWADLPSFPKYNSIRLRAGDRRDLYRHINAHTHSHLLFRLLDRILVYPPRERPSTTDLVNILETCKT